MLSNAYFLAKFRFDTAENEPAKNLQNFRKCTFEKCIFEKCIHRPGGAAGPVPPRGPPAEVRGAGLPEGVLEEAAGWPVGGFGLRRVSLRVRPDFHLTI